MLYNSINISISTLILIWYSDKKCFISRTWLLNRPLLFSIFADITTCRRFLWEYEERYCIVVRNHHNYLQYQSFGKWQQKNHEWKYNLHLPRVISIAFAYESRKKRFESRLRRRSYEYIRLYCCSIMKLNLNMQIEKYASGLQWKLFFNVLTSSTPL